MEELTLDILNEILASTKTRGAYAPALNEASEGDAIYVNFSEKFPGKKAASLKNSLTQNIEKQKITNLRIVVKNENVLVINMDNLAAANAAA